MNTVMSVALTPGGTRLAFEVFGETEAPVLLLISGLGSQMLAWDEALCRQLAAAGFRVVRFDNRDAGQSSWWDTPVDLGAVIQHATSGDFAAAAELVPYTLDDFVLDALALLDHLGVAKAHVVGSSMGGMVAQRLAAQYPERVKTLTIMMSSTGEREFGQATPEAMAVLFALPPTTREAVIERELAGARVWGTQRHFDEAAVRAVAGASFDRGHNADGTVRQFAATLASGPSAHLLPSIAAPTLVIHGLDDTLITPSGGERVAELIPGARLELVADMGHDRPAPLWPQLVALIVGHAG